MAQVLSNRTRRTILLLPMLLCICSMMVPAFADECPWPCTCQDTFNRQVNCSNKILLSPPTISASTLTLDLSHNVLGPVLNVSFVQMRNLHLIDLSHNGLTQVLECTFSGMLGLKTVRLRGNRLTSLPDGLFTDTARIEYLDLSHNLFTQLPQDVIKHLPELKTFDISHNLITELKLGLRFQVPKHIETMDLSFNHIEAITNDSFEIATQWEASRGRTINLAFCRISSIASGALSKIPNIQDLDLSGNNGITMAMLTNLIKELESGARNLDRLSLASLNLMTIVPLFTQVTELSLKFLNVSFNNISDVPLDVFSTIRSLRVLDLSWNSVTRLAAGFSDLSNLMVLNISHNKMESFQGDAVSHLSNLHTLDISHNMLSNSNRVQLSPLTKLVTLVMNNNFLASVILPSNTSSLRHLDCHSNRITEFSGLDDSVALETIDLSDNDLVSIAGFLFRGIKLLKLANFSKNNIETIDHRAFLPLSPLIIDVSHNFLKHVHYNNWVATQELYLNHNQITQIDTLAFHGMTSLQKLDLSQNKLVILQEDLFQYLINLKYLNLSHNNLNNGPWVNLFHHLDQLNILDLGHNNISQLSATMLLSLPKIQTLLLQKNLLRTIIPRVFRDAVDLKVVDLSNNPFDCSCSMLAFKDWLQTTKISVLGLYAMNSTAYHCKTPSERSGLHILHWSTRDFECSSSMMHLIIVCSVGALLIIAGVAGTVAYQCYNKWEIKVQWVKKQKEEERRKLEKIANMIRLSNEEIALAIQEAKDRKRRQHQKMHEIMDKQNNDLTRSKQTQRLTELEKSHENSKGKKKKISNNKNVKKETEKGRTRNYDKLKKNESNNEEMDKQQDNEKVEAQDKYIDKREIDRRRQSDDRFDPYLNDRRVILLRKLQHRYRVPHSEAQWRNQRLFNYEFERDSPHRPFENIRRNGPYIITPAYTVHDVYDPAGRQQETTSWRHAPRVENFQEPRHPYYQMNGYKTLPAVDREWPRHEREARVHERVHAHSRDRLPSDVNFVNEEESRYYTETYPDEQRNAHYGQQHSQSHSLLLEDYQSNKPDYKRDRAQKRYESILQMHSHPSQRAASQPVLATDWL
ncbi:hypothetical protein BsWGS_23236 [Bradybaena similaris]